MFQQASIQFRGIIDEKKHEQQNDRTSSYQKNKSRVDFLSLQLSQSTIVTHRE